MAQLTDATDYDVRRRVAEMATKVPGVLSFDRVRARRMGPQTLVDLTIQTEGMISASAAQQVRCGARATHSVGVPLSQREVFLPGCYQYMAAFAKRAGWRVDEREGRRRDERRGE